MLLIYSSLTSLVFMVTSATGSLTSAALAAPVALVASMLVFDFDLETKLGFQNPLFITPSLQCLVEIEYQRTVSTTPLTL